MQPPTHAHNPIPLTQPAQNYILSGSYDLGFLTHYIMYKPNRLRQAPNLPLLTFTRGLKPLVYSRAMEGLVALFLCGTEHEFKG
jgi:hypothetical protein